MENIEEYVDKMKVGDFYTFPLENLKFVIKELNKKYGSNKIIWLLNSHGNFIILDIKT